MCPWQPIYSKTKRTQTQTPKLVEHLEHHQNNLYTDITHINQSNIQMHCNLTYPYCPRNRAISRCKLTSHHIDNKMPKTSRIPRQNTIPNQFYDIIET